MVSFTTINESIQKSFLRTIMHTNEIFTLMMCHIKKFHLQYNRASDKERWDS